MVKRERRRRARSSSSSEDSGASSSSSDDSSDDDRRRRNEKHRKRHRKDDKKKRKKHKKSHSSERPSLRKARAVADELLAEFPALRSELVALLRQLRGGGVAVIGGIANKRIRTQLQTLFPLLGLSKLAEPKGAFALRSKGTRDGDAALLDELLEEVAKEVGEQGGASTSEDRFVPAPNAPSDDDDDDNDDVVGPALPGMKGFRAADERVEAEMARRELEMQQAEWDRVRGVSTSGAASGAETTTTKTPSLVRQEWMTVMPESSFFKDSLAPANRPTGKPAAFRSKEPAAVDHTWFDAPEERDRARRAKLDIELLGYVREENAPSAAAVASRAAAAAAASAGARGVNESIVPSANPEADDKMRREMERLRQSRGPSLLEQHQQRLAEEAKRGGGDKRKAKGGWDRERDLEARRGISNDEAARIIEASKGINAKFTAPTISRQFL
ncbi:hypothetical protein PybrP1_012713 [[Pythium] brassicae (nom. inval.)]|nr:hypothetical protein PybrP1_012713 [[Pythium] brassicae (nom. inval.)]